MAQITFIGAGSYLWMPSILAQLFTSPSFAQDRLVLMDIDGESLEDIYQLALKLRDEAQSPIAIARTTDRDRALAGADYVVLTISTGMFEATAVDLAVPEQYGIYHTVGDTVGPGGMNRALRNIPVLLDLARAMEGRCPQAWLLNLSNPLTVLTRVVTRETSIRAMGLCQGVEEHVDYLARLVGKTRADGIQFTTAGIDHCPWLLDLKIAGQDGYGLLRHAGYCSTDLSAAQAQDSVDGILQIATGCQVGFALWHELGLLPGISDRHMVENFGQFITSREQMQKYRIHRTTVQDRRERRDQGRARVRRWVSGAEALKIAPSHAPVVPVIDALAGRRTHVTTLNVENVGQIPELPLRANVETNCWIDAAGVHPIAIGKPLPRVAKAVLLPQIERQEGTIDAALAGDLELATQLLATDPLVRNIVDARAMLGQMIAETAVWLPQFARRGATRTAAPALAGV